MAMRGAILCYVAYTKEGKEVRLLCNPAAGGGGCEVGSGAMWDPGVGAHEHDKVVVIEGGESGSHAVAVYKFITQA